MTDVGVAALEEGDRVDFGRLRSSRLARCLAAMEKRGVDVLVLGRPGNVHWVSGARSLWTAGLRGFGPGAVVVRATGSVHLLSVWDEGVPASIGQEGLYGLSWNPMTLASSVGAVPGVADATTIGTDGMSPVFARLLPVVAPRAVLVDGAEVMWSARRTKTADEVACLRTACAITEAGLEAMVEALRPGVRERELVGVFDERIASLGVTTPAMEGVACVAAADGQLRQLATDRVLAAGDVTVLSPGALYAGYEGGLGRTWVVGGEARSGPGAAGLYRRWRVAFDRLLAGCRPEETGANLVGAWTSTGERLPPVPLVHGVGIGVEPPLVGPGHLGEDVVLSAGMVLAVQGAISEPGIGTVFGKETVLVGGDQPEVLTRFGWGPLAGS
jgi:Xaa-Pro dipeptidase